MRIIRVVQIWHCRMCLLCIIWRSIGLVGLVFSFLPWFEGKGAITELLWVLYYYLSLSTQIYTYSTTFYHILFSYYVILWSLLNGLADWETVKWTDWRTDGRKHIQTNRRPDRWTGPIMDLQGRKYKCKCLLFSNHTINRFHFFTG